MYKAGIAQSYLHSFSLHLHQKSEYYICYTIQYCAVRVNRLLDHMKIVERKCSDQILMEHFGTKRHEQKRDIDI